MGRYTCRSRPKAAHHSAHSLHLEDEQAGFAHFLARLRHAKAKVESAHFQQGRTKATQARRDFGDG